MLSRTYLYDNAGNTTSDVRGGVAYGDSYNAANRMSGLSVGGVAQASYKYIALGQ